MKLEPIGKKVENTASKAWYSRPERHGWPGTGLARELGVVRAHAWVGSRTEGSGSTSGVQAEGKGVGPEKGEKGGQS